MHNNQFTEVVLGLLDECKEMLVKKGEDYSTSDDRLDNFKSAEQFTSLSQWQCWEALFFKHIQSLRTYFRSGRKQLNEDVHHRIRDSINYLILLEAMLVEEKEGHATIESDESFDEGFKANVFTVKDETDFKYIQANIQKDSLLLCEYTHYSWNGYTYLVPPRGGHRDDGPGATPRV